MSRGLPLREDFDASTLRRLARSDDANQARRLLALATIYVEGSRRRASGSLRALTANSSNASIRRSSPCYSMPWSK
jgi:hypothetical protein